MSVTPNCVGPLTAQLYGLPARMLEQNWYAVYTLPRHEKTVEQQLALRGLHCYVPLYQKRSRWKDRYVNLQLPLFPAYVFVRISLQEKVRVLQAPRVVRIVSFNGAPAALPDEEIERWQKLVTLRRTEPHAWGCVGQRVRVTAGALEGLEGVIVRRSNGVRLVVSIAWLQRSVAVELEEGDLQLVA